MSDRSQKKIYLSLSVKRRTLLAEWLKTAEIKSRAEDGCYYGMSEQQTREMDYILRDLRDQTA